VALCLDAPDVSSKFAAEGTAAHKLCEIGLKAGVTDVGLCDKKSIDGFEVTEEMVESVNIYLETIKADLEKKYSKVEVEKQFKLTTNIWGTVDAVLVVGDKAYVYDFKYGAGVVVEVEDNPQLMIYALGAIKRRTKVKTVDLVIVQPRHTAVQGM